MAYTPQFTPTYPNGWVDFPSEETLVTAAALQAYDDTLENIEEYLEGFDPNNNLADQYDAEEGIYSVDDYVMYEDTLYQCITAVSEPETFDPEKWTEVKITDVMGGGGGGGTTVIANPTGEPTDDLETIQIGNTIYDIPGGGGNANIWTGTQAEYEAQASQIADDTVVLITDDEQEVVEGGTIYSEEEQVIGTWIDGSTLYEKVFTGLSTTTDGTSWVTVEGTEVTGLNQIIDADIYRTANNMLTKMPLGEFQPYNNKLRVSIVSSSFNGTITTARMRYTKATS